MLEETDPHVACPSVQMVPADCEDLTDALLQPDVSSVNPSQTLRLLQTNSTPVVVRMTNPSFDL